jgi:uncharacterized protein
MSGILRTVARIANRHDPRPPGFRERPERVVLEVRPGAPRSSAPPVRMYVGTEPGQHRAERVFVWSVEQARDPSRVYEIYLMADLAGFDRRRWLTGFTNYRFAIPHFAGGSGRAIYNDVDQIYLVDPATLFDLDMGTHGFLSITPRDTSVMLIDCTRMAGVWPLELAQRARRNRIEAKTKAAGDLWGPLPCEWNARDLEYAAGRSKVLHFTTIHTQPWQPFPQRFVYQRNPVGEVWSGMERAADAANFRVFGAQRPSASFQALLAHLRANRGSPLRVLSRALPGGAATAGVEEFLAGVGASSVLEYQLGLGGRAEACVIDRSGRTATRFDAVASPSAAPAEKSCDAAVCVAQLEYLPGEDVAWVLESLFRCARRAVFVGVGGRPAPLPLGDGTTLRAGAHPASWWLTQLEAVSARVPEVRWRFVLCDEGRTGQPVVSLSREGGRRVDGSIPSVWVLEDHKAGHTTQSVGLADAVGFPYEMKKLRFNVLNHLSNRVRGASRLGMSARRSAPLTPPWPDLVISTGRRTAPVARWIGRQSGGRTRLVQLGRRGGETVDAFDLVVACAHFRLPMHPRRMEIIAPLNAVNPARLAAAAERWRGLFDGAARPHIVLVVGGTSARHRLDVETARRLGAQARAFADAVGGSLFAITSPRTGAEATAALRAGLGEAAHLHEWKRGEVDNPYLGYLACADALVVTGESESMLAEAATTGHPLFIYSLPERRLGFRRPAEWVARRAEARPRKAKGTVRPQQGLEYLCARLIDAGIVRPPRHLDQLHDGLVRAGVARLFGAPFDASASHPLRESEAVARRVRSLLGVPPATADRAPSQPRAVDARAADAAQPRSDADDTAGRRVSAAQS